MSEHREPETFNTEPQDPSRTDVSLVTSSKNNSMVTPSASKTTPQDEYMSKMQQSVNEVLVQHLDSPQIPPSLSTYTPGVDFVAACQEQLDAAGWERFSAAMGRYVGHGELPPTAGRSNIFDEVRAECRALLEGRADLQAQWDEVYGDRETWQRVHDVVGLAKRGEDVKGSV
ncbi:hypothetical protein EsH8_IX_000069 [Colletotrichum jinshuiense]